MNPMIIELEDALMEAIIKCHDRTVSQFGTAITLNPKQNVRSDVGDQAVTSVDLENQETILQHVYKYFPTIAISVEERLENPSKTQAAFYENDNADILLQLDPLDGTYCYANGIRPDYGIIASIVKKVADGRGKFISGIVYYPSLHLFIKVNEGKIIKIQDSKMTIVECSNTMVDEPYSCAFTDDNQSLHLNTVEKILAPNLYSIAQLILQLIDGEIPGFVTLNRPLNDHAVGAWVAQQYGLDAEYPSGERFSFIQFGDVVTPHGRTVPRDNKGLLIVGNKEDSRFEEIKNLYLRGLSNR